jgi:hypothetical protein
VTPDEARAELAAKTEAWKRLSASLAYITRRYGQLTEATAQATAYMQQVSHAWYAAGGGSSAGLAQVPGAAGGSAAGEYAPERHGGSGGSAWSSHAWGGPSAGASVVHTGGNASSPGSAGGGGGGGGSVWTSSGGNGSSAGGRGFPVLHTDGFSETDGPPLVAGSVTGYRWWTLTAPDLTANPLDADEDWDPEREARLRGVMADWQPGVNQAACLCRAHHDPDVIPVKSCGCGYWAYWGLQQSPLSRDGAVPVFGVVKGFGRTRVGPYGFRVAKARILAVHLPLVIANREHLSAQARRELAQVSRPTLFTGRVISIGTSYVPQALGGTGYEPEPVPEPDPEEVAADKAKGEAWLAVIGDRIEQLYPGVRVFETRDALLKTFPPDAVYGRGQRL